ncbi:unnamed protein product [Victoria cruziana]
MVLPCRIAGVDSAQDLLVRHKAMKRTTAFSFSNLTITHWAHSDYQYVAFVETRSHSRDFADGRKILRKEASRYHLSRSRERDILALQMEPASRGNITGTPASGNCDGKWEGLSSSNEQVERFHCRTTGAGSYTQQTFIVPWLC